MYRHIQSILIFKLFGYVKDQSLKIEDMVRSESEFRSKSSEATVKELSDMKKLKEQVRICSYLVPTSILNYIYNLSQILEVERENQSLSLQIKSINDINASLSKEAKVQQERLLITKSQCEKLSGEITILQQREQQGTIRITELGISFTSLSYDMLYICVSYP
jgi:hypothetical protein